MNVTSEWHRLKDSPPGTRFQAFYVRQQRHAKGLGKALYLTGALASFAVGVVLVFIPGPAFVFFILSAALLATQSSWVARHLDALEVKGRAAAAHLRARWRRSRHRRS